MWMKINIILQCFNHRDTFVLIIKTFKTGRVKTGSIRSRYTIDKRGFGGDTVETRYIKS